MMVKKLNRKKIKSDPVYFINNIIYEGQTGLVSFQAEWLRLAEEKKRICLMAFRTSGKSRQLFVNYFIWKAIVNPKTQYLIISKTLPQAIELLKDIRITILSNPYLKTMVPKGKSITWSRTELEFKNHSRILSKAFNDNVRGLHNDGVGCDEMGIYEDQEIFKKAVLPTLRAKNGFFIGVGTPKSELDLLHAIERDPGYSSIHFDRFPAEGPKGNLFELRYPHLKIVHQTDCVQIVDKATNKTIETYDNMTWSQEFLLKPISLSDKLFPDHLIQACLDLNEAFQEQPKVMKQYFMGIDFAMSAQSGSDYTVITVLEKSPDSKKLKIVLIERWCGLDYMVQKQKIQELAERFQVIKILGDEGSFGKAFIYDLRAQGLPIDGFKFSSESRNKEDVVKALRDQFEKEGFIIPYSPNCAKTRYVVNVLMDELAKFGIIFDMKSKVVKFEGTGRHDDTVISLGLANFIARHISMANFSIVRGSDKGIRTSSPFFAVSK